MAHRTSFQPILDRSSLVRDHPSGSELDSSMSKKTLKMISSKKNKKKMELRENSPKIRILNDDNYPQETIHSIDNPHLAKIGRGIRGRQPRESSPGSGGTKHTGRTKTFKRFVSSNQPTPGNLYKQTKVSFPNEQPPVLNSNSSKKPILSSGYLDETPSQTANTDCLEAEIVRGIQMEVKTIEGLNQKRESLEAELTDRINSSKELHEYVEELIDTQKKLKSKIEYSLLNRDSTLEELEYFHLILEKSSIQS